jgi:GNAT superfamily N-acetyltransferase
MATIQELESFNLSDAVSFHKELNPRLWEDEKLDSEVRDQLLLIAEDFVEYLGINNLNVQDVTISGSNAAYSYTPHSDIDLHILVDFNDLPNNEVYQELFTAKKTLYNDAHDITVHGIPVELYVQDTNNPVQSLGEYSIVHDKWIRIPKRRKANFDQTATKLKYEKLGDLIELALKTKNIKKVNDTIALVRRYRKSGLDKTGEFGPENLAFKAVRKQGLIKQLYDLKSQLHGERLSIEEYATEDYDPNKTTAVQGKKVKVKEAKIDAHREGDTIWINYFEVPVRGKGLGKAEYEKFEKSLPKDIKKIRLVASDAGYGPTHDFWDRMGFDYAYPDDDNEMVKLLEAMTDLQVYRNPSPKQLFRLTQRSAHKHMRGMYYNGDTYWWDANDAIHKQGSDYLSIPYDYQQRMEAAIDSISDNYRVGGDDGVPQNLIQKYDIENELVYEASEKFSTDNRPKLIGLSFSDLEKLSESAGSDYNKFDRNISAKLNLPKHRGSVSNTLNLYSVYRKHQIYESTNKRLSDTEKKLFSIFNSRVTSTIESVKPGDSVSLLMLSTLSIPNDKMFVNLQGFLNPKQVESITSSNGIDYLHFDDGTKFPETDNDDPMYLSQSWAMTKLFDSYDSASKAYLMYALEGEKSSDDIQFNVNVDIKQDIAETDPLLEFRFQEIVHTNPTVATLKSLAKNNKYGAARFTITQDGTLKAGDSEKFTHQDISPDYKNVIVRGYVTHASGNDYIFKGSGPYDGNYTIDHPMFRKFERAGLINGNKDQMSVTESIKNTDMVYEGIEKVSGGWRHELHGYRKDPETGQYPVQPLPLWSLFDRIYRPKPGSGDDILHYMDFLVNDYRGDFLPITGSEIANTISTMYGTDANKGLDEINAEHDTDWTWDELLILFKIERQKRLRRSVTMETSKTKTPKNEWDRFKDGSLTIHESNATDIGEKIKNSLGLQQFYVFERGDTIEVSSLIVGKENQGKGLGSKAMQQLIDYADSNNKRITLTPGSKDKTHGTTSRARLVQFYKSLGFKESKGRNLDYAIGAGKMYRDPKSSMSQEVTKEATVGVLKEKNDPVLALINQARAKLGEDALYGGNCGMLALALASKLKEQGIAVTLGLLFNDADDLHVPSDIIKNEADLYHVVIEYNGKYYDGTGIVTPDTLLDIAYDQYGDDAPGWFTGADPFDPKVQQVIRSETNWNKPAASFYQILSEASGYIPSAKEKNDPRFKTALTVDVGPNAIKKNAKAFGFKTSRAGIPPQARADGKLAESLMNEWQSFLAEGEQRLFEWSFKKCTLPPAKLREYFEQEAKDRWNNHRIPIIGHMGDNLVWLERVDENTVSPKIKELIEFQNSIVRYDQRANIEPKVGGKISIIQSRPHTAENIVELRGFLTPKTISHIETREDHIAWLEFDDGSSFPDKTLYDMGHGNDFERIATLIFPDRKSAEGALSFIYLQKPEGWEIGKASLGESAVSRTDAYFFERRQLQEDQTQQELFSDDANLTIEAKAITADKKQ